MVKAMRMKNAPPSGSVECWSEETMLASRAARKPETAATMPWRSAQEISSRACIASEDYGSEMFGSLMSLSAAGRGS